MRIGTQIIGKPKALTVKDLMKILKRMPDEAKVMVPAHTRAGYYQIHTDGVEFDDEEIHLGS